MDVLDQREETVSTSDEADFLATARRRFADAEADEKPIREQALLDLRFVAGDQWDQAVKTERTAKGRPALTFNRCHTFVQQVSNEARQNKPQIKFVAGDGGDEETAEVKEGIARHIQYASDAQIAYETAVEYSAGGSFGYFGFIPDYCDDDSWDQEIKARTFYDPFAVYGVLIPSCFGMEPQFAFVIEEVPISEYKRLYGCDDIERVGWDQASKQSEGWIGTETVRVAEYWYIEYEKKTLKRKVNGKEESRTVQKPIVKFCKINGLSIIPDTETEWKGYCIPIVPVLGKQIIIDGKPNLFSVVRFQRDPQQLINFYKTRIAETLGTSPIQPWVVVEGQVEGHEKEWREQNTTMLPYLTIKGVDIMGKPAPMPVRQTLEAPIQSLSEAAAQEIDDMKATAGIYDASLGNKSNETSGIALQRRQQQSNVTNMHFMDNLERAFKKGGLIIADAMPYYYDTKRMVEILGPDEAPKIVRINQPHLDNGQSRHYKVGGDDAGKYHEIVTMERGFSSKRMETFDMMSSVIQAQPDLMGVVGDIFFKNSDAAGSDVMADRIKRFIQMSHPGLIEDDGADPAAQLQQAQAELMKTKQQMQALTEAATKLQHEKDAKVIEHDADITKAKMQEMTKISVVKMQEATKIAVAQINASKDANQAFAEQEIAAYDLIHSSAHEAGLQATEQAHEKEMAQIAQAHTLQQGDQQHQQTLEQQDQAGAQQAALADQQAQLQEASPANG